MYVAQGWNLNDNEVEKEITGEYNNGGLFIYSDEEKERIHKLNMRGRATSALKTNDMVAYLIELGYDLALSSTDNVSENPGFESCLGIW